MDGEEASGPAQAGAAKARVRRRRRAARRVVRWSARRERMFLAHLAKTSNVAASARAAGVCDSTVYRRRQRCEAFRARWAEALREGLVELETQLLERALNGVEKPVWHGGRQVGTVREYSDRLALALLAQHRGPGADAGEAVPAEEDAADLRARIEARLAEMNRNLGGEG